MAWWCCKVRRLKKLALCAALASLALEYATKREICGFSSLSGYIVTVVGFLNLWFPGPKKGYCNLLGGYIQSIPEHRRSAEQLKLARWGGFSLAASAMRRHLDDVEVCRECAGFFCSMANFNRESSLIAGRSDAIAVLLQAMWRHPNDAGFQAQASASMGCWCDWTPETEEKVASLGGPQAILKALKTFPDDAHVQFLGWAGLSSVSNRLDSKRIIMEAGALNTGMEIMRDPVLGKGHRVRQEIIMTFANLAANCDECAAAMMGTGDIIQQVLKAMREEEPDAERGTMTDGIQLMMELARTNLTSRRAITDAGFIPVTLEAMKRFPKVHPQAADTWPLVEIALQLLVSLSEDNKEAQAEMVKAGAEDVISMVIDSEPKVWQRRRVGGVLISRFQEL